MSNLPSSLSPPSPNTDSPLSITSSVLGILTFALGLFGFYLALISATRSAPGEILRLVSDLRSTQAEINRVSQWIFEEDDEAPGGTWVGGSQGNSDGARGDAIGAVGVNHGGGEKAGQKAGWHEWGSGNVRTEPRPVAMDISGNQLLYEEVQGLLVTCIRLFYEADDLLKRSQREGKGLWRRVLFVMNRDEVLDKVGRLQEQKARLASIQMSLFLRKSTAHDAMLRRIVNFIDDIEAYQKGTDQREWPRRNSGDTNTNADGNGAG